MSLAVAVTAFLLIFPIELPDKTFIATLVLATRYRPLPVWVGVSSAFLVQTVVACALGAVIAHQPRTPVEVFAGLLFLAGAVILLRGAQPAGGEGPETAEEFAGKPRPGIDGWRAVGASC